MEKELLALQDELDSLLQIPDVASADRTLAVERSSAPLKRKGKRSKVNIQDLHDSMSHCKDKLDVMRNNNDLLLKQKKRMKEDFEDELNKLKHEREDLQTQLEMCGMSADLERGERNYTTCLF